MFIHANNLNELTLKALPLAVISLLGSGLYSAPGHAALPTNSACTSVGGASTCHLWAKSGTISPNLPGSAAITTWGYTATEADPLVQPGGPVLVVNQGDAVTVTLHNRLGEPTSLLFQGQNMPPDTEGVTGVGPKSYTFTATTPGTYLYEAGLLPNTQHQPAMGLYGALVVRPAGVFTPPAGQAYGGTTDFNDEALVLLSEIDPALNNNAGGPATFDMRNYNPKYFLINGKVHPNTDNISVAAGNRILLRYVNAGIQPHSMAVLGLRQQLIATDGSLSPFFRDAVAETLAPGQTLDAITTIPAGTPSGSKFALYDAGFHMNNSNTAGMGGMLTFLSLGGEPAPIPAPPPPPTPPADTAGPVTSGVNIAPNPTNANSVALEATGNDTSTGNSDVVAAEYTFNGGTTGMTVPSPGPVAIASGTINTTGLADGVYPVAVRSQDSATNWGAFSSPVNLTIDRTPPATTAPATASNGVNGVNSTINAARVVATATDALSNVTAVRGYLDGNVSSVFPFIPADGAFNSLTENAYADIPLGTISPLSSGWHQVHVQSQDAAGNWSAYTDTDNLLIDRTAPAMTAGSFSATPNPTFGNFTLAASATDPAPTLGIGGGEWFEGADPGVGQGHPMGIAGCTGTPATRICSNENARALNWGEGIHNVTTRAKDTASNWTSSNATDANRTVTGTVTIQSPIYFSTQGNTNPPGVGGTTDDADIYFWNGTAFSRYLDASASPYSLAASGGGNANVDGFVRVNGTQFYMSFNGTVSLNGGAISAQDEDVAYFDGTAWSIAFDGTSLGLGGATTSTSFDLDAVSILGTGGAGNIYFSTDNNNVPGGGSGGDDADIYRWNGSNSYTRVVDASSIGIGGGANVDGLKFADNTHFYLSFSGDTTLNNASGTTLSVQDEDVVYYNSGTWSVYFDGTAAPKSLTSNNLDIDAFDIP